MTEHSLDIGLADFQQAVLEESKHRPVLVDFWAPWCEPCKSLKPVLEKLAAEYGGKFLLAKINSDDNQELAARYGVRGIPSVKAFIDGEPVDEFSGALPESEVRAFLDRLVPGPADELRAAGHRTASCRRYVCRVAEVGRCFENLPLPMSACGSMPRKSCSTWAKPTKPAA